MRNNKGISMITLIITIIVMIILAAIAFMAAGDQVGSAQFSKFASEFGEYATNFANAPVAEVTEALGMSGKATNKAQKIYAAARDIDLKNFDAILNGIIVPGGYTCTRFQTDIKDATGATVELASSTTPVYEIKSDVMKEYDGKKFYGDANGKETHWVTSKGTVFTLPGYPRIVDGEERMYITADLYYLSGSGDMITADDLVPVEPVKVGGDVATGSQTAADAADSVTGGNSGETGEEDEETPDFSDQTTIEGCPLKFGRAYVNTALNMALLAFVDGGALVGVPDLGWSTGSVDYYPAGALNYEGSDILAAGTVMATCNEGGTEVYYNGYTFTLEPELLGTNDYCSHTIIRSEAAHYVQTYVKGETDKYTGDTYCIYCNELVKTGREKGEATMAEIKVGDYVSYTPNTSANVSWRVWEVNGNNVVIMPTSSLGSLTLGENGDINESLRDYNTAITQIEAVCDNYASSLLGVTATNVRSLTIEDLEDEKVSTLATQKLSYSGYGEIKTYTSENYFGASYDGIKNNISSTFIAATTLNPVVLKNTIYYSNMPDWKTISGSSDTYGTLLGRTDSWLASTCEYGYSTMAYFEVHGASSENVGAYTLFNSHGGSDCGTAGVRPLVTLSSSTLAINTNNPGDGSAATPWNIVKK